ncbi:MAG: chloride channel protein [Actinomycetes bacterium]
MATPTRALGSRIGARLSRASHLNRWVVLSVAIGLIAGSGAIVFYATLTEATHLLLGVLAGYHIPTPAGEGGHPGSAGYVRPWAIPLVVGLGGLLSGWLVFTFAPEAEGHGTDAAIAAVHHNPRGIRVRAIVVKILASALTIGSGGSGGREGPTGQISAGFGSLLARWLNLSTDEGRVAVSVGIGSGIGAIFSAPLGGALLAAEIVYREDFESAALLPGLVASVVAYSVFGSVEGFTPLFHLPQPYRFDSPGQLLWFAVLGIVAGGVGLLYAKSFYAFMTFNKRLPIPRALRPAAAGVVVGLIALPLPEVLGTGYGWIQRALVTPDLAAIPLLVVVLLPFARIVATSLSIGSGGSGGVFGPGMVIGAFTGAALWRLVEGWAPAVPHDPAAFVVVGMMACFGAISRAPIAVTVMVAEMTGSIAEFVPAMIAVGLASMIVRHWDATIYSEQLRTRDDSAAVLPVRPADHRHRTGRRRDVRRARGAARTHGCG